MCRTQNSTTSFSRKSKRNFRDIALTFKEKDDQWKKLKAIFSRTNRPFSKWFDKKTPASFVEDQFFQQLDNNKSIEFKIIIAINNEKITRSAKMTKEQQLSFSDRFSHILISFLQTVDQIQLTLLGHLVVVKTFFGKPRKQNE